MEISDWGFGFADHVCLPLHLELFCGGPWFPPLPGFVFDLCTPIKSRTTDFLHASVMVYDLFINGRAPHGFGSFPCCMGLISMQA